MSRSCIKTACLLAIVIFYVNSFANDHGTLSGRVAREAVAQVVSSSYVFLYDSYGNAIDSIHTDIQGNFTFNVPAGGYLLSAEGPGFVKEYYNGHHLFSEADVINIVNGQNINVRLLLNDAGQISGIFDCENSDNNPGLVTALKIDEPEAGWYKSAVVSDPFPNGYILNGLIPGIYKILGRARANSTLYYPGVENFVDAAAIIVCANNSVNDIWFSLQPSGWGAIQGRVIERTSNTGMSGISVSAYQWHDFWQDPNMISSVTGSDGTFVLQLPAGEYFIYAVYPSQNDPDNFEVVYYNNSYDPLAAAPITVRSDRAETGMNFLIDSSTPRDYSISGNISCDRTGSGLDNIVISAIDCASGQNMGSAYSAHNGEFSINNLAAGNYLIMFSGPNIVPYFYNEAESWQDGEVIALQGRINIRTQAITQDYGNFGLAIYGRVESFSGPLAGARIYAYPEGEVRPIAYAQTNSQGEYCIINGLAPGSYTIKCDLYGYSRGIYPEPIELSLIDNPQAYNIDFMLTAVNMNSAKVSIPDKNIRVVANYPNPFNSRTTIELYSDSDSPIETKLIVYNLLGQIVGHQEILLNPGPNIINWTARNFDHEIPSGTYFYKIDGMIRSYRMTYLK